MSSDQSADIEQEDDDEGGSWLSVGITVGAVALLGIFYATGLQLGFLLMSVVVISIVIWQVCDPFADAAQWIGTTLGLPGSVRGATLDAIASSLPELFSGIFFVVLAITAVGAEGGAKAIEAAGAEGYGSTIATCAGSAIYNMILIPAIVAITIAIYRRSRPTVDVEDEVLARDGVWFLVCEMAMLVFLFQNVMYWWMAVILLGMYVVYIFHLYRDTAVYRRRVQAIKDFFENNDVNTETEAVVAAIAADGIKAYPLMVDKIRDQVKTGEVDEDEEEEEPEDGAGVLFGFAEIPLNHFTAWTIIVVSTALAAGACYFLVEATRGTADLLNVPTFFVAVILAAAASSVPDTFLSVGSAMRGDDSGAVSNAFGSNIFDICICLSIPLLVNSYLVGWGPVSLTQNGEPIAGLVGLRISLFVLTGITLAIMWHNRQLTFNKAIVLIGLYCLFIAYAVLGSLGMLHYIGL